MPKLGRQPLLIGTVLGAFAASASCTPGEAESLKGKYESAFHDMRATLELFDRGEFRETIMMNSQTILILRGKWTYDRGGSQVNL